MLIQSNSLTKSAKCYNFINKYSRILCNSRSNIGISPIMFNCNLLHPECTAHNLYLHSTNYTQTKHISLLASSPNYKF